MIQSMPPKEPAGFGVDANDTLIEELHVLSAAGGIDDGEPEQPADGQEEDYQNDEHTGRAEQEQHAPLGTLVALEAG